MAIDIATFRLRFPRFSEEREYSNGRIQLYLNDSINYHMGKDESRWRGKYDYAQAYLAAHLLTVSVNADAGDSSANAGPVASKTAGGVSVSRAVVAKDRSDLDDFYMSTSYGQQFLNIRNTTFVGATVASKL